MAKLRQLLLSNELRRYIDQHSDGRISSDRNKITWDRLFNQVATLVLREVEHCIKPVTNRKSNASQQGSSKGTKMSKVLYVCVVSQIYSYFDLYHYCLYVCIAYLCLSVIKYIVDVSI